MPGRLTTTSTTSTMAQDAGGFTTENTESTEGHTDSPAGVNVEGEWTARRIIIRITDDGDGFPPSVIGRIGDPFVRARRSEAEQEKRPGYDGMGLGLFIAKTLLERSGADLSFANATDPFLAPEDRPERSGAVVEAVWDLDDLAASAGTGGLGENTRFG